MKKFLSYLWPNTKRFFSEINGTLEVTYINGKKVLDTENANYSYGSLQKILEYGISKVRLESVENVLILGMGGGSVIQSLRENFGYTKDLVAIEVDPKIIQIAKEEFEIEESENQRIIQEDALQYLQTSEEIFQLIIIDLFIDLEVPLIFYGKEFCQIVAQRIEKNGSVILNVGVNLKKDSNRPKEIISHFGNGFDFQVFSKVNGANTLLVGKKSS